MATTKLPGIIGPLYARPLLSDHQPSGLRIGANGGEMRFSVPIIIISGVYVI